jgi:hypothetical protein
MVDGNEEPVRDMSDAHAQQRRESGRDCQVQNLPSSQGRPPFGVQVEKWDLRDLSR